MRFKRVVFSNEPFGYYLTVGPSFKVSYLINKDFWVDGVLTCDIPFAKFNDIFGGLQSSAGVYAVVARPKQFKSTFLQSMAEGVVKLNKDTKS